VCFDLITHLPATKYRDVLITRAAVASTAIHTRVLKWASEGGVSEGEIQTQALDAGDLNPEPTTQRLTRDVTSRRRSRRSHGPSRCGPGAGASSLQALNPSSSTTVR